MEYSEKIKLFSQKIATIKNELAKDVVADNINDIVTNVTGGGEGDTTGEIITEVVNSIFDADYSLEENNRENEIAVVTESLKIADKLMNGDSDTVLKQRVRL